ncbi:DNA repair protein RadA, partial [candidate division WOR-3 bacterium]|nr:DNA repair protein RadA [candidate division WOR-3 bacterium]
LEGTRVFLVEIQALTSPTYYGYPQRVCTGINPRRLSMLLAVVEKKLSFPVSNQDVFLNIVGGLKIDERGCDLGIIVSIVSSLKGFKIPKRLVVMGEVGLSGELRGVSRLAKRIKEAERLGFERAIVPRTRERIKTSIDLKEIRWVSEAIRYISSF